MYVAFALGSGDIQRADRVTRHADGFGIAVDEQAVGAFVGQHEADGGAALFGVLLIPAFEDFGERGGQRLGIAVLQAQRCGGARRIAGFHLFEEGHGLGDVGGRGRQREGVRRGIGGNGVILPEQGGKVFGELGGHADFQGYDLRDHGFQLGTHLAAHGGVFALPEAFFQRDDLVGRAALLHRVPLHAQDGNEGFEGFIRGNLDRGIDGHLPLDRGIGDEVPACGFADVLDEGMNVRILEIQRQAAFWLGPRRSGGRETLPREQGEEQDGYTKGRCRFAERIEHGINFVHHTG